MAQTPDQRRAWQLSLRTRNKELADVVLGTSCVICGREIKNALHRKDGRRHPSLMNQGLATFEKEITSGEYVRLCYPCHKGVHWAMDYLGMTWQEIGPLAQPGSALP